MSGLGGRLMFNGSGSAVDLAAGARLIMMSYRRRGRRRSHEARELPASARSEASRKRQAQRSRHGGGAPGIPALHRTSQSSRSGRLDGVGVRSPPRGAVLERQSDAHGSALVDLGLDVQSAAMEV